MTIHAVGAALPQYLESTAAPGESGQFRIVGHSSRDFAGRQLSVWASMAVFFFVVCVATGASWDALLAVLGAIFFAVVAWIVSRRLQLRGHRGPRGRPDVYLAVAVTTQRVVCMSAAAGAAPAVTFDRPRSDLRGVSVGTTAPRWYVAPLPVVRVQFHDERTVELVTPGLDTDGTESALRLAGVPVFDLDGAARPRPAFAPTGFVASAPRRTSTPAQARAKLLSCGLMAAVLLVAMLGGLRVGAAIAGPDQPALSQQLNRECATEVVDAVGEWEQVVGLRYDAVSDFGRGTLIVGVARVDGSLGGRDVDFTCTQDDDGIHVTIGA